MNGLDVVERLERLSGEGAAGDWLDVVQRCERNRAAALRRRVLVAAAAVVVLAVPALAVADRITEFFVVSADSEEVPTPKDSSGVAAYIAGNRLYDFRRKEEQRLARPVIATGGRLVATLAMATPDGRAVLYRSSEQDPALLVPGTQLVPLVVRHDLETQQSTVIARAADSFAIRGDGVFAYARRSRPDALEYPNRSPVTLVGHVFVRPALDGPATRWTTRRSVYTVHAWAGDKLIVSALVVAEDELRGLFGSTVQAASGTYALSGPGRAVRLPIDVPLAVDPTGTLVAGTAGSLELSGIGLTKLRIVRVADGKLLAELELAAELTPEAPYGSASLVNRASWVGDDLAVGFWSPETGGVVPILRFDGNRITVAQILTVDEQTAKEAGLKLAPEGPLYEPLFVDRRARELIVRGSVAAPRSRDRMAPTGHAVILVCDRDEGRCRRGKPWLSTGTAQDFVFPLFAYNPSRPLPGSGD